MITHHRVQLQVRTCGASVYLKRRGLLATPCTAFTTPATTGTQLLPPGATPFPSSLPSHRRPSFPQVLDVSHNQLTSLPASLTRLAASLTELRAGYNALAALPPAFLPAMARLAVLQLEFNHLADCPQVAAGPGSEAGAGEGQEDEEALEPPGGLGGRASRSLSVSPTRRERVREQAAVGVGEPTANGSSLGPEVSAVSLALGLPGSASASASASASVSTWTAGQGMSPSASRSRVSRGSVDPGPPQQLPALRELSLASNGLARVPDWLPAGLQVRGAEAGVA